MNIEDIETRSIINKLCQLCEISGEEDDGTGVIRNDLDQQISIAKEELFKRFHQMELQIKKKDTRNWYQRLLNITK